MDLPSSMNFTLDCSFRNYFNPYCSFLLPRHAFVTELKILGQTIFVHRNVPMVEATMLFVCNKDIDKSSIFEKLEWGISLYTYRRGICGSFFLSLSREEKETTNSAPKCQNLSKILTDRCKKMPTQVQYTSMQNT